MATTPTYEKLEKKVKKIEKEALKRKEADQALRESKEKWRSLGRNRLMRDPDGTAGRHDPVP